MKTIEANESAISSKSQMDGGTHAFLDPLTQIQTLNIMLVAHGISFMSTERERRETRIA